MKEQAMTGRTLREYCRDARKAAERSHALWKPVNEAIARVLEDALRRRHSRQRVYSRLMTMAGPKQAGEPVAVESYRSAARQIANGVHRLTLI